MQNFKLKDIFTALNLFLSLVAVLLLFSDRFELAAYLLFVNIIIIDVLDGLIARLTKTSNDFGKHFDSVTDFFGSSMIVPFYIFYALKGDHFYLAIVSAFVPLFAGVIREVNSRIYPVSYPGYFVGFPRNASALIIVSFLLSTPFTLWHLSWLAFVLIVFLSYLQLSHIPFIGNNKPLLMKMPRVKLYLIIGASLQVGLAFTGFFWDGAFIILMCFVMSPFVWREKEIRSQIKNQLLQVQS